MLLFPTIIIIFNNKIYTPMHNSLSSDKKIKYIAKEYFTIAAIQFTIGFIRGLRYALK